jgi:hypothetical protein
MPTVVISNRILKSRVIIATQFRHRQLFQRDEWVKWGAKWQQAVTPSVFAVERKSLTACDVNS